jgi:hypothetical protein
MGFIVPDRIAVLVKLVGVLAKRHGDKKEAFCVI